jgi:hypothetical protein
MDLFSGCGPDPKSAEGSATAIIPLRATDPQTRKHLKALLRQEVPGDLEVIVAVEERSDPAVRLASRLQERYDRLRVTYSEERGARGQVQQGLSSTGYGEKLVEQLEEGSGSSDETSMEDSPPQGTSNQGAPPAEKREEDGQG